MFPSESNSQQHLPSFIMQNSYPSYYQPWSQPPPFNSLHSVTPVPNLSSYYNGFFLYPQQFAPGLILSTEELPAPTEYSQNIAASDIRGSASCSPSPYNEHSYLNHEQGSPVIHLKEEDYPETRSIVAANKTRKSKTVKDCDYKPNRPEKRIIRKRIHENANRNILPNELHQIASFLMKSNKSGHLLNRIMKRNPPPNPQFKASRFYLYQTGLKEAMNKYGSQQSLKVVAGELEPECCIWEKEEQLYYC